VTSIQRTIVDLAGVIEPGDLELALASALRSRLTTLKRIEEQLRRSGPTVAGRTTLRSLLDRYSQTESALETAVLRALRQGGLPSPACQHEVRDTAGRLVARVDFAYPDARVAIEADGYRYHSRLDHWRADRSRQNVLTKLGWRIYRVTWDDVTMRAGTLVDDIAALLHDGVKQPVDSVSR